MQPTSRLPKRGHDLFPQFLKTTRRTIGERVSFESKSLLASKRTSEAARIRKPHRKPPKLALKRLAKGRHPDHLQRAEAKSMKAPSKGNHPRTAAMEQRSLQASFDRFRSKLQRIVLPVPTPHLSKVIRLNCSHSSAFGLRRMHIAHRMQQLPRLSSSAARIGAAAWPSPVTANADVKSEVAIAVDIPDIHSIARSQKTGKSSASQVTSLASKRDSFSARARDRGPGIVVIISGSMQFFSAQIISNPAAGKQREE